MKESTNKLIQLLKDDCTIDTLKQELKLTTPQLIYRLSLLKHSGYAVNKKYYGNGDITFSTKIELPYYRNEAKINTRFDENSIRMLIVSDLHYFNINEDREAINRAFDYCVKNGIHIILVCGDLIDCMENNETPISKQAEQFAKLYPHDDKITSFCVLGNHDAMCIQKAGIDLKTIIDNKRMDIVPINYSTAAIYIKNDRLILKHPTKEKVIPVNGCPLTFIGHSHRMKICENNIYVPSLSKVKVFQEKQFGFLPYALDVTIEFNDKNKAFKTALIDQLVMEKEPYITGEYFMNINHGFSYDNNLEIKQYPSEKIITKSI